MVAVRDLSRPSLGGAALAAMSSGTVPAEAQSPVTMALILPPIALSPLAQ